MFIESKLNSVLRGDHCNRWHKAPNVASEKARGPEGAKFFPRKLFRAEVIHELFTRTSPAGGGKIVESRLTRCAEARLCTLFLASGDCPHRLSVRTQDSQSWKRGSIPRGGATHGAACESPGGFAGGEPQRRSESLRKQRHVSVAERRTPLPKAYALGHRRARVPSPREQREGCRDVLPPGCSAIFPGPALRADPASDRRNISDQFRLALKWSEPMLPNSHVAGTPRSRFRKSHCPTHTGRCRHSRCCPERNALRGDRACIDLRRPRRHFTGLADYLRQRCG
jgi:hypothetical protein